VRAVTGVQVGGLATGSPVVAKLVWLLLWSFQCTSLSVRPLQTASAASRSVPPLRPRRPALSSRRPATGIVNRRREPAQSPLGQGLATRNLWG
jgi:hypothetical protein